MSARLFHCTFLVIILLCGNNDCIKSSTNTVSVRDQHSSSTTPANSFTSLDNNTISKIVWLPDALKDIAYYLRAHKFNEYDRRYEPNAKLARKEYYMGFPRPPLRSLHWEVHKYCEQSLVECVDYLRKSIRNTGMKRTDDTGVVINEQQWDLKKNSKQIETVDKECKKFKELDDIQANPFEGPIERFQWRVTASYYMCWYTMLSEPALKHLSDECDNFANCLDPDLGPNNKDQRANDAVPFACALYSFCPDPCCPMKHLTRLENCWNSPDNPCFQTNPTGQRECVVNRSLNTDFRDLVLNRWNVSCSCPQKGFEWNSLYGMCVDVDECATGTHNCDHEKEMCLNLPGKFKCICKWGHSFNKKSQKCAPSDALTHLILQREQEEENVNKTIWIKILELFQQSNSSEKNFSLKMDLVIFCALSYSYFM